jgi:hypothetical protein
MLGDAAALGIRAHHEAGDVLQEQDRHAALVAELDEVRALQRGLREQHAVVGQDADRQALYVAEAAHQGGAVQRLELVEFAAIDQAGDDLALIEGARQIGTDDARDLGGVEQRRPRRADVAVGALHAVERAHDVARPGERFPFVAREVIGDARDRAVHLRAAQRVAIDDLADRGLHDLRPAEMHAAGAGRHDHLVGQGGDVGAARRAFAEHRGDLRDARRRHAALAIERPAEMVLIGENLVALGEVRSAAIDQIDHRKAVLEGDVLGAHVLADGLLEERPALGRGVVGDDHADHAADRADAGHQAGGGHGVVVQPPGGERRQLEKGAERIDQQVDALAHRDLAALAMALDHALAAAGQPPCLPLAQRLQQAIIDGGVGPERLGHGIDRARQRRHGICSGAGTRPAELTNRTVSKPSCQTKG